LAGNQLFTDRLNNVRGTAEIHEFDRSLFARPIREASMPRVLVVDDQADVRTIISIVLRIHHFEIVEAESAASALKLFDEASFDLAIVDIFLQGTNGSDLITTLRARAPGLPVVAISGMTPLDFLSETPELSGVVCLQKPFRPPDLMRAIEAAQGSLRPSADAVAAAAR
jgi:DNA-binding NtrC family response regulator